MSPPVRRWFGCGRNGAACLRARRGSASITGQGPASVGLGRRRGPGARGLGRWCACVAGASAIAFGLLGAPASAAANAVVPATSAPGTSATEITNDQQVTWQPNDDGTWPCGGSGSGAPSCPGPDGESGPAIDPFGFDIDFYGSEYGGAYINNNGNLTFQGPLPEFTPSLSDFGSPIIAPFFADVDTRGPASSVVNFGRGTLGGHKVFVVNWPGVGCFNENSNVLDDFQLIVIDRADRNSGTSGDDFDIEFNYDTIAWDTGQASGGDANCRNGAAGNAAYVGFSNGTAADTYVLPGSGTPNAFLDATPSTALIANDLGSSTPGRYLFTVVNGQPTQPTTLATSLSGGGQSGDAIIVPAGTAVSDGSVLSGANAPAATGSVTYDVYSDAQCTQLVSGPDAETITTPGTMPGSRAVTLAAPGTYYWQASYSGDSVNDGSVTRCGSEVETVEQPQSQPTTISTVLSGAGLTETQLVVPPGASVSDQATLSGANAGSATGTVTYSVYADSVCSIPAAAPVTEPVTAGAVPPSPGVVLPEGDYYWLASYSGDPANGASTTACASEMSIVRSSATSGADVGIALAVQPASPLKAGTEFVICVTITNFGPNVARAAVQGLLLPGNLTVANAAGGQTHGRLLTWSYPTLAVGQTVTDHVWVVPAPGVTGNARIWAAGLALATADPNGHNNVTAEDVTFDGPLGRARTRGAP